MLIGRGEETAVVDRLLESARSGSSGVLVVRGEAGIGKTSLLEHALREADGMTVLHAVGIESESELPFAALHQLLRPVVDRIERLPEPQAEALRAAFALSHETVDERFRISVGVLGLLSEVAEEGPLLCVVDDAQWLDEASADALAFAARRLHGESLALLFAARDDEARPFVGRGLPELRLDSLDRRDARALVSARLGAQVATDVVEWLLESSNGNPLALVELPGALTAAQLEGRVPLSATVTPVTSVEQAYLARLGTLPASTRRLLTVAAAEETGDRAVVARAASGLGLDPSELAIAEAEGLVRVDAGRIEFRHPLLRSAVYKSAGFAEREHAHRALADALPGEADADRRAWHRAAATVGADEEVAEELERSASRSRQRGGHGAAAAALVRAADLSEDDAERGRRLVRAATNFSLAGRDEHAVVAAEHAAPLIAQPALRAEVAHVRGLAALRRGRPHEVVAVLVEAAQEIAPTDPARAVELLMDATSAVWQGGDIAVYLDIARLAATVEPPPGADTSRMIGQSLAGFAALINGDASEGSRLLGEVAAWGATTEEPRYVVWASFAAIWLGDEERFGALLALAASLARARGEIGTLADTLGIRAGQLAIEQRYDEASVAAIEGITLARELAAENLELLPLAALAIVSAVQGRDEDARRQGEEVLSLATANGLPLRVSPAAYALALVDLGRSRWTDALERLDSLSEGGALDPWVVLTIPDRIEAAVRASKPEQALAALHPFEAFAGFSGAPSAQPRLAACRALLATGEEATQHFEAALELAEAARPFDLGRIHLLYGEHLRRERRRSEARVQLRAALQAFDRLRAEPWAERAGAELRATGETTRKRDPSTVDQLTPQELQVAGLVAEGQSNKEVAAQLFLSPRTVEYHLRKVFMKLGITSRAELIRHGVGAELVART